MKKALIIKNFDSSWGVQNRVESLVDWAREGLVPYEIDINGNDALITIDGTKRESYESAFQYNDDLITLDRMIKDMNSPMFADDGISVVEVDMDNATPEQIKSFRDIAVESVSSLGSDMLRINFGIDMPSISEELPKPEEHTPSAAEIAAQASKMAEDLDFTPDGPIPQYNSETGEFETPGMENGSAQEIAEKIIESNPEVDPAEVIAEAVPTATLKPEDEPQPLITKIVDPREVFVKEFMEACKEYDVTPKALVACIMSIKALANQAAVAKDDKEEPITPEDVTGSEDYSYQNAVPYVEDPHKKQDEDVEIAEQGMNVSGAMNNVEFGDTIKAISGNESIQPELDSQSAMSADEVYGSLMNESFNLTESLGFDGVDLYGEPMTNVGLEAFFSKHKPAKSDNEVLNDINKICEDAKRIAKKAWNELREKNKEIFEKYGAFIKILLDIKDIVMMDKRYVKLEIARFDIRKANNEIVPDTLEESILKKVSGAAISAAFGPLAGLAKKEDKPGQIILIMANRFRETILSELKPMLAKYKHPSLSLVDDDLGGSPVLTLAFPPLKTIANESIEEDVNMTPEQRLEKIAMETANDEELYNWILDHKSEIPYKLAMEASKCSLWHKYNKGEDLTYDHSLVSKRVLEYIRK